ncbi:MAG: ribosome small subunit-dependent GTPase A [Phycisphaerales bacterium]|nr:ribosome small subunit-dependent GTPase A [Phycisphaerales bacterium]
MNRHQRQQLEKILDALPKSTRDELFDRARAQRSEAQKRRRSRAPKTIEGERIGNSKRRPDPLIDWVLRIVEKEHTGVNTPVEHHEPSETITGTVVGLTRRRATVLEDAPESEPIECRLSAELAARQQAGIAVGDRVDFIELDIPGDEDHHEVTHVHPRKTKLARPDAHNPNNERVVASNVDTVVIVVSVVSPPLHPRLIDRYLIALEAGGIDPIIAVNKADLMKPGELAEELKQLNPYKDTGIPVVVCAADPGDESASRVDDLRKWLQGKTCAFVGHSGVGKSSLANALDPALGIDTGRLRGQDQRGRHTTTASTMHFIDPDIRVIDTPGVRFFGIADITPEDLHWYFPEFAGYVHSCKFTDCTHEHEPGCAVKTAVDAGEISRDRYDTYLRLLNELRTGGKAKDVSERIRPLPDPDGTC